MSEDWYFTENGQQQGPVALAELKRRAASGQLRPDDLVWRVGLPQWMPASLTRGLFPDLKPDLPVAPELPPPEVLPVTPTEAPRAVGPGGAAPPPRPAAPQPARMSGGARAALIAGIGTAVLLIGAIVALVIVHSRGGSPDPSIINGRGSYVVSLREDARDVRRVQLIGGRQVRITVQSDFNTDVDLHVFNSRGNLVTEDIAPAKDCFVNFFVPSGELYRIEVTNLGPGFNRSVVRFE
jgi:hypothetical protein